MKIGILKTITSKMQQISKFYASLAALPIPVSGKIRENYLTIQTKQSLLKDSDKAVAINHQQQWKIGKVALEELPTFPAPVDMQVQYQSESPSGKKMITFKKGGKDNDKVLLELWNRGSLMLTIDVTKSHGKGMFNGFIGGCSWSDDESHFVYVADQKPKETCEFWDFSKTKKDEEKKKSEKSIPGDKYVYEQDLGELFEGIIAPKLFVVSLNEKKVVPLKGIEENEFVAHPQFVPGEKKSIVYTVWEKKAFQMGMVYNYQRPCAIKHLKFDDRLFEDVKEGEEEPVYESTTLTPDYVCASFPRFTPSGDQLIFLSLQNQEITHNVNFQLSAMDWESKICRVVVPQVPRTEVNGGFPGLYCYDLPEHPFASDGKTMFLNSAWGFSHPVVSVDIESGSVHAFTSSEGLGKPLMTCLEDETCDIIDVNPSVGILVRTHSPVNFPVVQLWKYDGTILEADNGLDNVDTMPCEKLEKTVDSMADIQLPDQIEPMIEAWPHLSDVQRFRFHTDDPDRIFEALLTKPKLGGRPDSRPGGMPLIVWPHGGPHAAYCSQWQRSIFFFQSLGFAVLKVNYRGSTGYGRNVLNSLLGNIAVNDVGDTKLAIDTVLLAHPELDKDSVFGFGGSHSGYMIGKMTGLYPDLFRAVCLRNAVLDLPSLLGVSDLPDWVWAEAFGYVPNMENPMPTAEQLTRLMKLSCRNEIDQIKTPTLLLAGGKDKRVPHSQSLTYHKLLKAKGVDVRTLFYPEDSHPLSGVSTAGDDDLNAAQFLLKYLAAPRK
eukprot:TRINITY_DN596227_c0_g1_i1.p1 TRINITY_DN596227_c0_g1~~TRINITY_DN596227_c0_g1_i1.p1  ORF type:complete len:772 (+),score=227.55 TRINITY_DN596227_c0_g1_i1:12-2327(+)